jgi:hypothetical protein
VAKRKGTWDDVLEELPKSFGQDPDRQEKIDAIKAEIRQVAEEEGIKLSPAMLTRRYGMVRAEEERINAMQRNISLSRDAYEQLIADAFDEEGITRTVLSNGEAVTTFREPRPKVIDPEAYRLWCIEHGYEKMLTMHSSKTTSLVKERLAAGEDEPDGVVARGVLVVRYNKPGTKGEDKAATIADIFEQDKTPS